MVCSLCNCSGHNKATCPLRAPAAEMRAYTELCAMLPALKTKEVSKPLVDPHMTWMREFARMLPDTKKVTKPLEGLAGCINIFKEPKVIKTKKVTKSLDGLAGCQIFKEPKANKSESKTRCGQCGLIGHNSRTCQNRCQPCSDQSARAFCFAGFSAVQATSIANML